MSFCLGVCFGKCFLERLLGIGGDQVRENGDLY
jgi:hypothetical protein